MRPSIQFAAWVAVVASLAGWGGYVWGRGPDPALAMWASRSRGNPVKSRPVRDLQRGGGVDGIQLLLREDRSQWDYVRQREAWDQVRAFSIGQVKDALAITGEKLNTISHNIPAEMLFYRWGELDPQEAMRHVQQLPGDNSAIVFGSSVLIAWMRNDPESAYRWSLGERNFAEKLFIGSKLAATLLAESPASAMEKSLLLGGHVSSQVASQLAQIMATDPESRAEYLSAVAKLGDEARSNGTRTMVLTWGRQAPAEVIDAWDSLPVSEEKRPELLDVILHSWGRKDPSKAAEWIAANPDKVDPSRLLGIYQNWLSNDSAAAGRWLETQVDPATFASQVVREMHSDSLNNTMGHIFSETAKQQQQATLRQHYQIWADSKPDEAAQWLESIGPEAAKTITGGTR